MSERRVDQVSPVFLARCLGYPACVISGQRANRARAADDGHDCTHISSNVGSMRSRAASGSGFMDPHLVSPQLDGSRHRRQEASSTANVGRGVCPGRNTREVRCNQDPYMRVTATPVRCRPGKPDRHRICSPNRRRAGRPFAGRSGQTHAPYMRVGVAIVLPNAIPSRPLTGPPR